MKNSNSIRLAIADDHAIFREGLVTILSNLYSYSIEIEASEGNELIQKIQRAKLLPDICLLDINMPNGMNGYETLDFIKKNWPTIGVVILSMYSDRYAINTMLSKGAGGYVLKNSSADKLHSVLLSIYYEGFYASDSFPKPVLKSTENFPNISGKEMQIIKLISVGKDNNTIAQELNTSIRTVQTHCNHLYGKLNIHSREELILFSIKNGLCDI